jgi:hypothetical protein
MNYKAKSLPAQKALLAKQKMLRKQNKHIKRRQTSASWTQTTETKNKNHGGQ